MIKKFLYLGLMVAVAIGVKHIHQTIETRESEKLYAEKQKPAVETNVFFLPTSTTGYVVHHDYYSLSYHEEFEQAEWVAYELKKNHLKSHKLKRPYFTQDKSITTLSADWRNYKKSGYDRGHLCPAGDRKFSKESYYETFLTSNVSPQKHSFNAGVWNRLEQKVRHWANRYDGVFVVTGGILKKGLPAIGKEQVAVPEYFYKVVLDRSKKHGYKMIGFLMPHEKSDAELASFVVPIDSIEQLTGIDFFPKLNDSIENKIEAKISFKGWQF